MKLEASSDSSTIAAAVAPASVGQRLLWFMDYYQGAHGALNCPVLLRFRGQLDVSVLQASVDHLVARHEALRTTFTGRGSGLLRVINAPDMAPVEITDLSELPDPDAALDQALVDELRTRVEVETWPVRTTLWQLSEEEYVLCLNMHHLATDAWSCGVISNELGVLYGSTVTDFQLPVVEWQFSQFAEWQQHSLTGERLRALQDYWRRHLEGAQMPSLPPAEPHGDIQERRSSFERAEIGCEVVDALRELARSQRTTLFTVMLALFYALFRDRTGQTDQAVASMFANRSHPKVANTVGFLANMIILRCQFDGASTFMDLVSQTRKVVLEAFLHQELPYQMLPVGVIKTDTVRDVVFQVFAEPLIQTDIAGLAIEPVAIPDGLASRFDLDFALTPRDRGFEILVAYANDRFDRAWVSQIVCGYVSMAAAVAANPTMGLSEIG
jgi:Condensation domain